MTDHRERDIIDSFVGFADRLIDDVDVLDLTTQLTRDCARLLDVAAVGLLLTDPGGVMHLWLRRRRRPARSRHSSCNATKVPVWSATRPVRRSVSPT